LRRTGSAYWKLPFSLGGKILADHFGKKEEKGKKNKGKIIEKKGR
jgi:predicted alpha/beta-fold hydrolase